MNRTLGIALIASLVALGGCFSTHPEPDPTFDVDVAITATTLGEDCPSADADGRFAAGACAPAEDGESDVGCGGWCQGSSLGFAITADADRTLSFSVRRVTLLAEDGSELMELTSDNPRLFDETDGYVGWDETIPTPSELGTLYDLHGIDWSGMEDSYGRTFRVRAVIDVEGETRTLVSEETTREYPIVT
jgi:hypothetical protein